MFNSWFLKECEMNSTILTLLAFVPFVLLFLLIIWRKWPAIKAMPLTYLITILITITLFNTSLTLLGASFIKGTFIATEIMLIIFGAVFFIEILKEKGQIKNIQSLMSVISNDARIQAIIIAFLFGSLIEGIAGFGTPAALAAPLLVSIGFTPFLAVVLSLIANSTAVSFGAAGTPVLLGLGGLGFTKEILMEVTKNTALIHTFASSIIPLTLVYLVISHSKAKAKWKSFVEISGFAIFAWLSFIVPYFLIAFFIGPELPSIAGGFIGLIVVSIAAHYKFLTPKNVISFSKGKSRAKFSPGKALKAVSPYLIIIVLLLLSRVVLPIKNFLTSIDLTWAEIFGTDVGFTFLPLYTPSFYFLLSALFCVFIFRARADETTRAFGRAFNKIKVPLVALIFVLGFVQLLLITDIPLILAQFFQLIFRQGFAIVSPFVGVFGSFIAGSNTVSNLLFASFQAETAQALGLSLVVILSLQVVGGAIGNMIAIHNVLAASATVGLKNQEGRIIRKTILVALLYALVAGVIGVVILSI
jgi:lactate permease